MIKVVAFCTDDKLYYQHAMLLKKSLEVLGVELHLEVIPSDEWQKVIAIKPDFINRMCKQYECGILYIDADAFVHKDITAYFDGLKEDIAAHYFDGTELTSGTLFINDTKAARELVSDWVEAMMRDPDKWDQKVLEELVGERIKQERLSVRDLKPEYTYIYDLTPQVYADGGLGQPIIEHLQASREKRYFSYYENTHRIRKRAMGVPLLSKRYRKLLVRRKHTQFLAKKVGIEVEF